MDSNPLVAGKGVQILREHGIEVETGILEAECLKLNEVFYHYIKEKTPFVVMKYAMTLDGKIACATGDSKWVTGEAARKQVHEMRNRYKGIMAGIGTVLADDPLLNCRIPGGVDPIRIICDSKLRIPVDSQIVKTAQEIQTIVVCTQDTLEHEGKKAQMLNDIGIQIIAAGAGESVDLKELMVLLGAQGIDSILLEGGGTLNASALKAGIVNKVYAYIAGKLVGGQDARSPVEGNGIEKMRDAVQLSEITIDKVGEDICICGYPIS
jgi:diaminohydroxyphosphoribosylaminopyrimidine deaminase/5-amino-6-(5-phosphoribosylamino)uracil reductase